MQAFLFSLAYGNAFVLYYDTEQNEQIIWGSVANIILGILDF